MIDKNKAERLRTEFRSYTHTAQPDDLIELIERGDFNAETLAWGMFITADRSTMWSALEARLQVALTQEHVAAQERMTAAADKLQRAAISVAKASWAMGVASFIVTVAALYVAVVK